MVYWIKPELRYLPVYCTERAYTVSSASSLMHAILLEKPCQHAAVSLIFEFLGFKSTVLSVRVQADNIQTDSCRSTLIPSVAAGKLHKFLHYTHIKGLIISFKKKSNIITHSIHFHFSKVTLQIVTRDIPIFIS